MDLPGTERALKRWRFIVIFWPLVCFVLAGMILCQPYRGAEERFCDAMFAVFPLIFFAIGMKMRHRLLKERRYAIALTIATVVSRGRRTHSGKSRYFPEYEFQVGEKIYKTISKNGYSACCLKEGEKVELYYAPENLNIFYVPLMQKHDNRWAMLLCGVGIVYPLIGLFAPQIRGLVSFLN